MRLPHLLTLATTILMLDAATSPAATTSRTVKLDLAAEFAALQDSTPGPVSLSLKHRLPGANYSIELISADGSSNSVAIKSLGPFTNWFAQGDCAQVIEAGRAVLAAPSEQEVAARWQELWKRVGGTPACNASFTQNLEQWVNPTNGVAFTLEPGATREIRVRREASPARPARTWTTRFAAGQVKRTGSEKTEEVSLRNDVERGLARFVAAAAGRPLPESVPLAQGPGPRPHVWSPEAYTVATKAALTAAGVAPPAGRAAADDALPAALLDPRSATIDAQARLVSARLSAALLDPTGHEQAALLLGTLALRESAGAFTDIRPTLSRMTVHLTLARVVRGAHAPSPSGRYASILLSTLAGRQQEALDALAASKAGARGDVAVSWTRALETAVDHDWRRVPLPAKTLLEAIVTFRAMTDELGVRMAARKVGAAGLDPALPDWGRIGFSGDYDIELGHVFAAQHLKAELEDAQSVLAKEPASRDLTTHLKRGWGPAVTVEAGRPVVHVLDAGAWADSARRHLLAAVVSQVGFMNALGLPDEAKSVRNRMEQHLGDLPAFDLVLAELHEPACDRLAALVTGTPELVPARAWHDSERQCRMKMSQFPPLTAWFDPLVLPGTVFDAERIYGPAGSNVSRERRVEFHALAPYDEAATRGFLLGNKVPTAAERIAAYGRRAEYSTAALGEILEAQKGDPVAAQATGRKLCAMDESRCLGLGDVLRDQDPDAAADAYEKAIAGDLDAVTASHYAGWLVDYYLFRGDRTRARVAAERGAATGSGAGMQALAWYNERTGDMASAERLYRGIVDRYQDSRSLDLFLVRRVLAKDTGYDRKAAAAMARVFPLGVRRYDGGISSAPLAALRVLTDTPASRKAGLFARDQIVAVDGYALDRPDQFDVLRQVGSGPIALVVWSPEQGRYRTVSIPVGQAVTRDLQVKTGWEGRVDAPRAEIGGVTVDQLLGAARDKRDTQHKTAIQSLLQFEDAAVPAMRSLVQDGDWEVRQRTFLALQRWPLARVAVLRAEIFDAARKEQHSMARAEVFSLVRQMAQLGDKPSVDLLFTFLDDADPDRAFAAASQLPFLGAAARPALPRLKALLAQDTNETHRIYLKNNIQAIEASQP